MNKQIIIPMIAYEDGIRAMEWLKNAFGFQEKTRWLASDGTLSHGELEMNGAIVMLASPSLDYESPKTHRSHCPSAQKVSELPWITDGVLVYVDNIKSHFQNAKAAGARLISQVEEQDFGWLYRTEDFEGHRWMFIQGKKENDR